MYKYQDYLLCPNVDYYQLSNSVFSSKIQSLSFMVDPDPDDETSKYTDLSYAELVDDTNVYNTMINRSFNPDEYNERGYMDFVAMTQDKFSILA